MLNVRCPDSVPNALRSILCITVVCRSAPGRRCPSDKYFVILYYYICTYIAGVIASNLFIFFLVITVIIELIRFSRIFLHFKTISHT